MKKLLLATVFGGLLIAAPAIASDDDSLGVAVAISAQGGNVEYNEVDAWSINANDENEIEDRAFQNAIGIFHVQQNTGANSLVQASTAVGAILDCGCEGDDIANISVAVSLQGGNVEDNSVEAGCLDLYSDNEIKDRAFQNATGIFQVQQNTASNSLLQSSVAVSMISGS